MGVCAFAILAMLLKWSAPSVREDPNEVLFYLLFCLLCVTLTQILLMFAGISLRDDVVKRDNRAAEAVVAGVTLGATLCAGGANVGEGPGFEVVLLCAALSIGSLLFSWVLIAHLAGAADRITIERDLSVGMLTGGWLAGIGMAFAAGVAGDWISLSATLRDFARYAFPVFGANLLFSLILARVKRGRPSRGRLLLYGTAALLLAVTGGVYARFVWNAR